MDAYELVFWILLGSAVMLPIINTAFDQFPANAGTKARARARR